MIYNLSKNLNRTKKPLHLRYKSALPEILPSSKRRIFLPNPNKKRLNLKPPTAPDDIRRNPLGIQMLSRAIYNQIFLEPTTHTPNPRQIDQCRHTLQKHGMPTQQNDHQKEIDFKIPPIQGKNISDHFQIIAETQIKPYRQLLEQILQSIPPAPTKWKMQEGWTRYTARRAPQSVPYPLEQALVFDVEVCMTAGKAPTLATAVSPEAWYGWVSPSVISGTSKAITDQQYPIDVLIPLESPQGASAPPTLTAAMRQPKVVIGHNVSFDRVRIKEQYWLHKTGARFIDTMSLHVAVSGMTSYQRNVLKSAKFVDDDERWKNCSSLNSLLDVYKLYCNKSLVKEKRDVFVHGNLKDVQTDFQSLMTYCSNDVIATYEVLQQLYPLFEERFPHPVTLAGMLELGTAYLPINANWNRYVSESEQSFDDLENEARVLLAKRADQACQLLHDDKYRQDLWMWDQDWAVKGVKLRKAPVKSSNLAPSQKFKMAAKADEDGDEFDVLQEKFAYLWETRGLLSKVRTLLPGYPNWYRKLCSKPDSTPDWIPGPHLISTSMQVTPKLLNLTWEGYPLHYLREKGWGFLIPYSDDVETVRKIPLAQLLAKCPRLTEKPTTSTGDYAMREISKVVDEHLARKDYYARLKQDKTDGAYQGAGIWCNLELDDCCWFFKLPHKDGATYNVGNPLAKDFLNKFSENVLAGDTEGAEQVLTIARSLSYWRNNRARIYQQMIVWLPKFDLPPSLQDSNYTFGAILPQVVVCGTLTRRAMEPTWMTASNAHAERVGSELRAMIQAPPGYNIVGADVDSQELWIASILGDADHARMHGATPFGWMTLSGSKADATDMHSVTAKAVGISRDNAKVINYARIYGAGQNFAERLLKQFNPAISETEARSKAQKMFQLTKGKRVYWLKKEYLIDFEDRAYTKWQAFEIAKMHGKGLDDMFDRAKWVGGTESAMFNRLEAIANSPRPTTPFLDCRLSRALEPHSEADDRYLPTRVNWVVQSGAVDFLHLMLVCMKWIMGDEARFCVSFHDEVRYLVAEEYKYKAALAMHVTNLLTRSFCAYKLGLNDLPQSVAFFSSVEIDTVLRKEAKQDCKTPSNPHGLDKGYGIPNGESLDVYEAVQKACGQYDVWYRSKSNVESNQA